MELPEERFLRLDQGESLDLMGVKLTALYAEHSSGDQRDATGLVIEGEGLLVYQVGDSEFTERLVENSKGLKPDVLTLPINGAAGQHEPPGGGTTYADRGTQSRHPECTTACSRKTAPTRKISPTPVWELDLKSKVVLMQVGKHFRLDAVALTLKETRT